MKWGLQEISYETVENVAIFDDLVFLTTHEMPPQMPSSEEYLCYDETDMMLAADTWWYVEDLWRYNQQMAYHGAYLQ